MNISERQILTVNSMTGNWILENEGLNLSVQIDLKLVKLNFNGVSEEFPNHADWFGDNHLCFNLYYYVKMANEESLIFGKHDSSGVIGMWNGNID
jgi:hypothetical protein